MNERLDLATAAALPDHEREDLSYAELELSPDQLEQAIARWSWLRGVHLNESGAPRVRREVARDGPLIIAMHTPARELFDWFRAADWECFDETDRSGSDAWAWAVLLRLRSEVDRLGSLAAQCSIKSGH